MHPCMRVCFRQSPLLYALRTARWRVITQFFTLKLTSPWCFEVSCLPAKLCFEPRHYHTSWRMCSLTDIEKSSVSYCYQPTSPLLTHSYYACSAETGHRDRADISRASISRSYSSHLFFTCYAFSPVLLCSKVFCGVIVNAVTCCEFIVSSMFKCCRCTGLIHIVTVIPSLSCSPGLRFLIPSALMWFWN